MGSYNSASVIAYHDHRYSVGDLDGLEFLRRMKTLVGGGYVTGDAAAFTDLGGQGFIAATQASIDTMIAEAEAFWSTGVADTGTSTVKTGFSATTPFDSFNSYPQDKGAAPDGTGLWEQATAPNGSPSLRGLDLARGVRGAMDDATLGAAALALYTWVTAGVEAGTGTIPPNTSPQALAASTYGTYDPTLCWATYIDPQDASENETLYEWATVGLLGHIRSTRGPTRFKEAKVQMGAVRYRNDQTTAENDVRERAALRGRTGMSFQTSFVETVASASRRVIDVASAALCSLAYRETPQGYGGKDRA